MLCIMGKNCFSQIRMIMLSDINTHSLSWSKMNCRRTNTLVRDFNFHSGGGIFVDVGSAEGIISLEVAECAEEIYLIEKSQSWITALESTFKDYRDKVHIINKYAGSITSKDIVKLDDVLLKYKNENIFIKMDIEGMELEALKGCVGTMSSNNCTFLCAAYHTNTMEEKLLHFFKQYAYEAKVSDGYTLFIYGKMTLQNGMYERMKYPYFRRGLVRAHR
ncbi:MAG: FkbM family methyltransferase [Ruminococcus sp.]|nr:FkbM family methyltransferase [Ruminococcus sp.]